MNGRVGGRAIIRGIASGRAARDGRVIGSGWGSAIRRGVMAVIVAALAGFGVHLGRFARWNSWDLVAHPRAVLDDALSNLGDVRALGFSAVFAVLLLAMTIQLLSRESLVKTAS